MMVCLTSFAQVRRRVGISSLMRMFMMVMEREMEEERGGVVDIFFKGGTPNLEASSVWVQKGHYMGQLLVPPYWGSWRIRRPHLICSKTKQAEEEGDYPGRRSRGGWRSWDREERGRVRIMEDPVLFLSKSLFLSSSFESRSQNFTFATFTFCSCNSIILTDNLINQGLYTT